MALKFYESPFHVTHAKELATKMALKVDLSIMLARQIKKNGWTQKQAAEVLGVQQSRVSHLINSQVENFTIDAMIDMLDSLGYSASVSINSAEQASIEIRKVEAAA